MKKILLFTLFLLIGIIFLVPRIAHGAASDWGTIIFPTTKISSIGGLISSIIDWVLTLAGGLAVIAIVYSGIMYITASGDAEKAATARKNLTWAIMGIVFVVLAIVIVNFVHGVISGTEPTPAPIPSPSIVTPSPTPTPSEPARAIPSPSIQPRINTSPVTE